MAIEGIHYPNETITGKYTYADKEDDPEGLSDFQWFCGSNATGSDKIPIPGAIGRTYKVQTLDAGKYLFFEVQPVASRGNLNRGISVLSSTCSETPTLQSIFISNPASKLSYYVGDTLDITGLAVTGNYSDNSTKLETITAKNISGFDSTAPATDQILTITIGNNTTNYTVQIAAVTLQSIAVTTPANKLLYFVGDALDISGLAVTGTYSNGSTRLETITAANITGFDNTAAAANQILTITVDGKTTTYTVQIAEKPADECFIATAAFGSKFEPSVALLRDFRDQYLLTNNLGAAFVNYYYQKSPPIAATIASSEPLKIAVRVLLAPAIAVVYMIYHPILAATVLALLIVFLVFRLKSIKNPLKLIRTQ